MSEKPTVARAGQSDNVTARMDWRQVVMACRWSLGCGHCTAATTRVRVRVSGAGETGVLYVVAGSQRDNVLRMARARRGGGRPAIRNHQRSNAHRRHA